MFPSVYRGFWITSRRSYVKVDSDLAVCQVSCSCCCATTGARGPFRSVHAALVVDNGGMAGFGGYDAPRAVLAFHSGVLLLSAGPRFSASWSDMDRKPCTSPWRSHRCSSWTSLTCPLCSETGTCSAVCAQFVEIPRLSLCNDKGFIDSVWIFRLCRDRYVQCQTVHYGPGY